MKGIMAQKRASKTKGRNGDGESVTLFFDVTDPAERRALAASKLLASKHGRRKAALVAMLDAIYRVYETNGELMSPAEIGAALMGQSGAAEQRTPVGFTNARAVAQAHSLKVAERKPTVEVVASTAKASTVAANFVNSMRGLAAGFFE